MISNLTGLRFYLAFWVAIYHLSGLIDIEYLNTIIRKGYLAVDIFFVLSGYILTHVYFHFFTNFPSGSDAVTFLQKRIAKIYPMHLITLLGAIGYYHVLNLIIDTPKTLAYDQIIPQLLLIHTWGGVESVTWNFPSWSISAEWFAYLFIFPVTYILYRKLGFKLFSLVVLGCLLLFFINTEIAFRGRIVSQMSFGLVRVSAEFMYGGFAYLLMKNLNTLRLSDRGFILLLWISVVTGIVWMNPFNFDYYFVLAIPFLFFYLHSSKSKLTQIVFSHPVILFLGEVSFSLYMMHFFAMRIIGILMNNFFGYESNNMVTIVTYSCMVIGFAIMAYYWIEQPGRRLMLALFNQKYSKRFWLRMSVSIYKSLK